MHLLDYIILREDVKRRRGQQRIRLSGECVISSVLSPHSKNLKWRTSVTAQVYLQAKENDILQMCGRTDPKEERGSTLAPLLYAFPPPPEPAVCKLG